MLKSFMDVLILNELQVSSLSGYDFIDIIYKEYDILISPGTIYAMLYSLERNGLIEAIEEKQKRVYNLTVKGELTIQTIKNGNVELQKFLNRIIT
ncbi:MAG: PadR family transcriptional regulator [Dehalococcoidia bacterium]|nr:MAG: PadR family transcriptional regulator [Dehalococcoidia bacterium]